MIDKKLARMRRARKTRAKIRELVVPRLCVHRTAQHIYAQIIAATGDHVLAAASSIEKSVREKRSGSKGKMGVAATVGALVARRALEKGVTKVAFDRSGFRFHGRVKALADSARESGVNF